MSDIMTAVGTGLCHSAAKHMLGLGPWHCVAPEAMETAGLALVLSAALVASLALVGQTR